MAGQGGVGGRKEEFTHQEQKIIKSSEKDFKINILKYLNR